MTDFFLIKLNKFQDSRIYCEQVSTKSAEIAAWLTAEFKLPNIMFAYLTQLEQEH